MIRIPDSSSAVGLPKGRSITADQFQFMEYGSISRHSCTLLISQNVGSVAQGWRTDSYRTFSDGSTSDIHILAIDYRGYGSSTGSPTELGVIVDGLAAVNWAIEVAKVPSSRIVILGHSLGTAVASAVAEHFAKLGTDLAGVVLVAPFASLDSLLTGYSFGGYIPLLSPFQRSPSLHRLLSSAIVDTWPSIDRLVNFVRLSSRVRLHLIHSKDDYEIPWSHSEALFAATANATTEGGMDLALIEKMKARTTVDMGDGAFTSTWNAGGDKIITEEIVNFGRKLSSVLILGFC